MDFDAVWQRSVGRVNESIRQDDYERFMNLLNQTDVSVNSPDNRGYTPCHLACLTSNPYRYLVELLKFDVVDANCKTYDDCTPLLLICRNASASIDHLVESVKLLVEDGGSNINAANNHLEFPLLEAIKTDKYEIVEYLCSKRSIEIDQKDIQGLTSIYECVQKSDLRYLELLLRNGAKIDLLDQVTDYTVLFYAILNENCAAAERLIEVANQKGIKNYVNIATPDTSPLMIACQTNCSKCINCLLNHNADVNLVTSNQVTILHFVAEFCGPDVLDRIMERFELSRLPNFTDLNDERIFEMINPLHLAISSSNMNMIKYFIEKQLFAVDSFQAIGRGNAIHNLAIESKLLISALGFALSIGASRSIIDYLIQSGARLDLYSDLVVPPVFCVFSHLNQIKDHNRVFGHLLKIGFDINKFAKLRCEQYESNLILAFFDSKLLKKFINHGLDIENLFACVRLDQSLPNDLFLPYESKLAESTKSFGLVYRTKTVRRFWQLYKSRISEDNFESDQMMLIDKLFKTPNSLVEICKHEFRRLVWRFSDENSAKFHENMKSYPSFINA